MLTPARLTTPQHRSVQAVEAVGGAPAAAGAHEQVLVAVAVDVGGRDDGLVARDVAGAGLVAPDHRGGAAARAVEAQDVGRPEVLEADHDLRRPVPGHVVDAEDAPGVVVDDSSEFGVVPSSTAISGDDVFTAATVAWVSESVPVLARECQHVI